MPESEKSGGNNQTRSHVVLVGGVRVGHYRIVEKIGAGGMGEVYLAQDTDLDRRVALKFMPQRLLSDAEAKVRFKREAQATAKLDHPNIIHVYEVSEYEGLPYFAMQYLEGQTLRDLAKDKTMDLDRVIKLIIQICDGLHQAHQAGIVHRDIKPSNIFVDREGRAKILDFGLATIRGGEKLTKVGSTLGTFAYMSPEQALGKEIDARSDLFSLGIVLYELIAGRTPFSDDSEAATLQGIVQAPAEPLTRYRAKVPDALQGVVFKLLEKDPDLRYQSANGVMADLRRLLRESDASTPTMTYITTPTTPWTKKRRFSPGIIAGIIAAAVVVVVAGYFLTQNMSHQESTDSPAAVAGEWMNSIAVLPFRDFSPQQDQEYFCDGITDAIIGQLSGLGDLKVISMTSVMRYKAPDRDLKKIGQDLGVATILEGSIQKEADRIRIRAQLIRVEDDAHLWSETYDKDLTSIFAIQDEISRGILDIMKIKLLGGEQTIFAKRTTDNLEAYNAYMRGRYFWRKRTDEHIRIAIESFGTAIELDSSYALAWSGLADAWAVLPGYSSIPGDSAYPLALEIAHNALELDDELAEAHASLGLVLYLQRENQEAEREFQRAIKMNPGYVWSHTWYSSLLDRMGQIEAGVRQLEIALELDPLNIVSLIKLASYKQDIDAWDEAEQLYQQVLAIEPTPNNYMSYAMLLRHLNRPDEAIIQYQQAIDEFPDYENTYPNLANYFAVLGRLSAAERTIEQYVQRTGDEIRANAWLANLYANVGSFDQAREYYRKAIEQQPDNIDLRTHLASTYIQTGNTAEAMRILNEAIEQDPDNPAPYFERGSIYLMRREIDRAIDDFETTLDKDQNYNAANRALVSAYIFKQDYDPALRYCEELTRDENIDVRITAFTCIAEAYVMQGKFDQALAILDSSITIDSVGENNNSGAERHLQEAFIYEERQQYDLAAREADRVVELFSQDILAWKDYQAFIYALRGDTTRALQIAEELQRDIRASQRKFLISGYWQTMGMIKTAQGDYNRAVTYAEMAADSVPEHVSRNYLQSRYVLARAYFAAGRFAEAIPVFEKLVAFYGEERLRCLIWLIKSEYYLGIAYEETQQIDKAIKQYETFLGFWEHGDPGLTAVQDARERLARLTNES
ncbi:tetratricopeptide repeat protein [Candidatus Zixiibacteriota bacterium]